MKVLAWRCHPTVRQALTGTSQNNAYSDPGRAYGLEYVVLMLSPSWMTGLPQGHWSGACMICQHILTWQGNEISSSCRVHQSGMPTMS